MHYFETAVENAPNLNQVAAGAGCTNPRYPPSLLAGVNGVLSLDVGSSGSAADDHWRTWISGCGTIAHRPRRGRERTSLSLARRTRAWTRASPRPVSRTTSCVGSIPTCERRSTRSATGSAISPARWRRGPRKAMRVNGIADVTLSRRIHPRARLVDPRRTSRHCNARSNSSDAAAPS